MKRLWLTEGKEGAPGVRATLEAEKRCAELREELTQLGYPRRKESGAGI